MYHLPSDVFSAKWVAPQALLFHPLYIVSCYRHAILKMFLPFLFRPAVCFSWLSGYC